MNKFIGFAPLAVAAGIGAAVLTAPAAAAQPNCVTTGQGAFGGSTTQCSSPGNTQIVTSPGETNYLYPWNDYYYGPALVFGW